MSHQLRRALTGISALFAITLLAVTMPTQMSAQDRDDPPDRAARLGHVEGSVSFQPAGESEWVEAVPNRPLTIDDKLWADRDSRATVELGSASIYLSSNTGISFLNLDDRTMQIQLSSGSINVRVRRVSRDEVFEIDTPNQAFSVYQPGRYRLEASENGDYTIVTVREGEGESSGNGQSYTVHAGQRATLNGTNQLNVEVDEVGRPDDFDNWSYGRDRRFEESRSARYVSHDMVGYEDLDDYGDWQPHSEYGNVWFPRVAVGWAPYHDGHWAWIDPWGWTWVDDDPWGYAPFHYARWAAFGGLWGWIPGPVAVRPVYAPALVVFVGGGGFVAGGNVAWFALGPREVYVPSYRVSPGYVNRVNISNTTVNQTTITNVYNTTIVNNNTNITNVNYVNRNVNGAVTAVPQRAFVTAQPVNRVAVRVDPRQLASAQMSSRVAVAPAREAVLGARSNTAGRVAAPPAAVANRQVIARTAPPPPPPSFEARQQALAQHPGQSVPRQEMQRLRPASAPSPQAPVRVVTASKPAALPPARPANQPANTPQPNQPGNQPGNRPGNPPAANERPGMNPGQPNNPANRPQPNQPQPNQPPPNQPGNRPGNPPAANERPGTNPGQPNNPPNRPEPNQPPANSRPEPNRTNQPPARNDRPPSAPPNNPPERSQPNQPPANNRPEPNRTNQPPARNDRPPSAQPNNPPERSQPNQPPANNRPEPNHPNEPPARNDRPPSAQPNYPPNRAEPNQPPPSNHRPETNRPEPNRAEPANRPAPSTRPDPGYPPQSRPEPPPPRNEAPARQQNPPPSERPQPQRTAPPETRPAPQQQRPPAGKQTPEEKKRQDEQRKEQPQR